MKYRAALLHLARTTSWLVPIGALAAPVAHAQERALPEGGTVAAGSVQIGAPDGGALTVTQTSNRAIVNWQSFDVGLGNAVRFLQPDANAAILNRVTGATRSTIAGEIGATGSVYLVNPNGIQITREGVVRTGRGFVASTLDIADGDFLAGHGSFVGTGGATIMDGTVATGSNGFVALLGGSVRTNGLISAPAGSVTIGAVTRATLDLNGDGFLKVALPADAVLGHGAGRAVVSADAARDAVHNLVNLPAYIAARSVTGSDGNIILGGTIDAAGGSVLVSGTGDIALEQARIDVSGRNEGGSVLIGGDAQGQGATVRAASLTMDAASAIRADALETGKGGSIVLWSDGQSRFAGSITARGGALAGDGGAIETSGSTVALDGLTVDTSAANGLTGLWLIDPKDFTIATSGGDITGAALAANLATSNVTIQSSDGALDGNGDVNVNAAVNWSSANTLTLLAANNINIAAPITASGGGLTLNAGAAVNDSAAISIGIFTLQAGNWSQNTASLPDFHAHDFRLSGGSFLRSLGGAGTIGDPYRIGDVYGLQGLDRLPHATNFALANDVDASGTVNWNGGAGFVPIKLSSSLGNSFSGDFDGQGHVVSGLTINRPGQDGAALFATLLGNVHDLGLVNVWLRGTAGVAPIAVSVGGNLTNVYATGQVSGTFNVAGLVGVNGGTISNSHSAVTLNFDSFGQTAGGLVGTNFGSIIDSYATGSVDMIGWGGAINIGGLVGFAEIGSSISNSYATGVVSGQTYVGGLVGLSYHSSINYSYATGLVSGLNMVGGLVGYSQESNIDHVYSSGYIIGNNNVGGIVGFSEYTSIDHAYSNREISGSGAGGIVGYSDHSDIRNVYASGFLEFSANSALIGHIKQGTLTNGYWDSYSSAATGAVGVNEGGTITNVAAVTSNPAQSGAANYAYKASAYGNFTASDWIVFEGRTRPFGAWEIAPLAGGVRTVMNSHQLQLMAALPGETYVLGGDIDLAETGIASSGAGQFNHQGMWSGMGFAPIGTSATPFTGQLDGQGHVVSSLTIVQPSGDAGLFGRTNGATIRNIGVTGSVSVGAATGIDVGGLVGAANGGVIANAYFSGSVSAPSGRSVGGLIGASFGADISSSFSTGSVTGSTVSQLGSGGLVGFLISGHLDHSYSTASVSGYDVTGGLVGQNQGGVIGYSYASGAVSSGHGGGLVGLSAGGIAVNSYWNLTSTGQSSSAGGAGLTATQMTQASNYAGWGADLDTVGGQALTWRIYEGKTAPLLKTFMTTMLVDTSAATASYVYNGAAQTSGSSFALAAGADYSLVSGLLATSGSNAGSYAIGVQGLYSSQLGYDLAPGITGTLTITPAALSLVYTANAASSVYGNTPTGLTGSYVPTGLIGGDTLIGTASWTSTASGSSGVGSYAVTGSGLSASTNYTLTTSQAAGNATALTVTTRPITITAAAQSRVYGDANPTLGYTVGGQGLVNGDTLSGILATAATQSSNVGSYAITSGTLAASGNYALSYVGATLAVTARPLAVVYSADAASSIYGDVPAGLAGSYVPTGLVNGDALTGTISWTTIATSNSSAGSYEITGTGLTASANYALTASQAAGNATALAITPRPITITADPQSRIYGDANPVLSYGIGGQGLVNGDTLSGALATGATTGSDVGSYAILQGTLAANGNYALSYVGANLGIMPRALSVVYTAYAASSIYGDAPAGLTGSTTPTGLVNGDTLSGTASWTTLASGTSNIGSYAIQGSGLSASANYALISSQAAANATALTITPRALSVVYSANAASSIYGDAPVGLTGTHIATGLVNGDTVTGTASWTTPATGASNIGSYAIQGSGLAASSNYMLTSGQTAGNVAALTITPRALSVVYAATVAGSVYGDTPTGLTGGFMATGLVNGDTLAGAASWVTTATAASNVGSYAIQGSGLSASANYTLISSQAAANATALTITPRTLSVVYSADAASSIYGDVPAGLAGSYVPTGLVNGDALGGAATWTTAATGTSNIGSYAIQGSGLGASSNYILISGQAASNATALTITPRALSVLYSANAATSIYGDTPTGVTGSITAIGLANGDMLAGTASWSITATGSSNIGSYTVLGSGLTASANYALTGGQAAGNATALTITPRTLSVAYTAAAASSVYGDSPADLTGSYAVTGMVNGDTLLGAGSWTTTATSTSNVGSYAIEGSGLTANSNYAVTSSQAAGNAIALTVTARPITVTATGLSRIYGEANPVLGYAVGGRGLINGDTLSGALATAAGASANVGTYAITQGTLAANDNYALDFVAANLVVTPRALSLVYSANAASSVYGDGPAGLTGSYATIGLVNGDTLGGAASWTTKATGRSDVGSYAIQGSGLSADSNYTLTSSQAIGNANAFTAIARPITVTADGLSRIFGEANPALTYTVGGRSLVNGDTLTGMLGTSAGASSTVGTYAITQGTLAVSGNYALGFVGAELIVTPRPVETPVSPIAGVRSFDTVAGVVGGLPQAGGAGVSTSAPMSGLNPLNLSFQFGVGSRMPEDCKNKGEDSSNCGPDGAAVPPQPPGPHGS
ncbi:MBG domain-containing protein [Sphingomonas sp. Root241]|uniref:MBG domain-containing protein n=1 Tax=Sphingomonas sp. Root241 TaxID=1736501 RepID=UPI0006FB17AE|nr:MBG domain-containing protein [Sphingomonas sp. Root241]KRC82567.1 hypothetical protein ASE13_09935 [Sphingomonas sp. Root241]